MRFKGQRRAERKGAKLILPAPFTATEREALRLMLDRGTGPARGLSGVTRSEAMAGLSVMAHRDPRRLGELIRRSDSAAVLELVRYRRSRIVT